MPEKVKQIGSGFNAVEEQKDDRAYHLLGKNDFVIDTEIVSDEHEIALPPISILRKERP